MLVYIVSFQNIGHYYIKTELQSMFGIEHYDLKVVYECSDMEIHSVKLSGNQFFDTTHSTAIVGLYGCMIDFIHWVMMGRD